MLPVTQGSVKLVFPSCSPAGFCLRSTSGKIRGALRSNQGCGGTMPGGIVLAGGDEFRPGCEEMDSAVLGSTGARAPRVLVIPTAAVTGPQKAASDGVRYFSSLGAQSSALMVLDKGHAEDEEVLRQVPGASVLYFTGGSPDHLLGHVARVQAAGGPARRAGGRCGGGGV